MFLLLYVAGVIALGWLQEEFLNPHPTDIGSVKFQDPSQNDYTLCYHRQACVKASQLG